MNNMTNCEKLLDKLLLTRLKVNRSVDTAGTWYCDLRKYLSSNCPGTDSLKQVLKRSEYLKTNEQYALQQIVDQHDITVSLYTAKYLPSYFTKTFGYAR